MALPNLVPRVSPLPVPWSERRAGTGETLGTRLGLTVFNHSSDSFIHSSINSFDPGHSLRIHLLAHSFICYCFVFWLFLLLWLLLLLLLLFHGLMNSINWPALIVWVFIAQVGRALQR